LRKVLYTAEAVTEGGRAGHARTADGRLDLQLSVPEDMGGQGGPGTNPEQLFAVGYRACFQSALWRARTSAARTPTPPAATSRSPSASTARPSSGPQPEQGQVEATRQLSDLRHLTLQSARPAPPTRARYAASAGTDLVGA
jgi:organic hydroperoxide reductase OsmC/OhrA